MNDTDMERPVQYLKDGWGGGGYIPGISICLRGDSIRYRHQREG
jgi:hypothetical protein